MKAIVCTKYGPSEVLKLREVDKPVPKRNEVLIKTYATSVTASDIFVRGSDLPFLELIMMRLLLGVTKPRNPIIGMVLAGEIEAIGKKVTRFKEGDQVYGFTGFGFGAYAEYICMPENESKMACLALKPLTMNYTQAAAVPYGCMFATYYVNQGNIQSGQKVLIYGASGAIGTTAVQLAKHLGANVTGVCGPTNLDLVKSLGADNVIDYTKEDSLKSGECYDFILDAAGKRKSSKFKAQCKNALTQKGKYISVDNGTPKLSTEYLEKIKKIIDAGDFKVVIDRSYPLEQIVEAHRYVEQGHKKGNVVITI